MKANKIFQFFLLTIFSLFFALSISAINISANIRLDGKKIGTVIYSCKFNTNPQCKNIIILNPFLIEKLENTANPHIVISYNNLNSASFIHILADSIITGEYKLVCTLKQPFKNTDSATLDNYPAKSILKFPVFDSSSQIIDRISLKCFEIARINQITVNLEPETKYKKDNQLLIVEDKMDVLLNKSNKYCYLEIIFPSTSKSVAEIITVIEFFIITLFLTFMFIVTQGKNHRTIIFVTFSAILALLLAIQWYIKIVYIHEFLTILIDNLIVVITIISVFIFNFIVLKDKFTFKGTL